MLKTHLPLMLITIFVLFGCKKESSEEKKVIFEVAAIENHRVTLDQAMN